MNEKKEVDVFSKKRPTVNELKTEVIYVNLMKSLMLILMVIRLCMKGFAMKIKNFVTCLLN